MRRRLDPRKDADDTTWFRAVNTAMGIGLLGIIAYSRAEHSWTVFACALLVGLAAGLVGAFLGFVFGVPKTVATGSKATGVGTAQYQGNTNLEEISDWLTKVLVGAGLVELKQIPQALDSFGSKFATNRSLGSFGWVAAPALVIAYCVCGFLLAYLWARIYMIEDLSIGGVIQTAAAADAAAAAAAKAEAAATEAAANTAAANTAASDADVAATATATEGAAATAAAAKIAATTAAEAAAETAALANTVAAGGETAATTVAAPEGQGPAE